MCAREWLSFFRFIHLFGYYGVLTIIVSVSYKLDLFSAIISKCRKVGASGLKVIEHSPELTAASLLPGEEFATPKGDLFLKVRKVWVKSLGTAPVVGPDIGSVEIPLSLKDEVC